MYTRTAPRRGGSVSGATSQAIQLQQYKQRLQQMHQQLVLGQQQLKELQKHPNQQQKVVPLTVSPTYSPFPSCNTQYCSQLRGVCTYKRVCTSDEVSRSGWSISLLETLLNGSTVNTHVHTHTQVAQLTQQLQNGLIQYQRLQQVIIQMQAQQVQQAQQQPQQPPTQQVPAVSNTLI